MRIFQRLSAVSTLRISAFKGETTLILLPTTIALADCPSRAILEVISVRLATSQESLTEYFSNSLISYTHDREFVEECLKSGLEEIHGLGLIVNDSYSSFTATQLGKAIVASSVDPYDGVFIHAELTKTLKAFVMDGEMHILYVFTPVQDFGITLNWQIFRNEMDALDDSGLRVLGFLGIKPTAVQKL